MNTFKELFISTKMLNIYIYYIFYHKYYRILYKFIIVTIKMLRLK